MFLLTWNFGATHISLFERGRKTIIFKNFEIFNTGEHSL